MGKKDKTWFGSQSRKRKERDEKSLEPTAEGWFRQAARRRDDATGVDSLAWWEACSGKCNNGGQPRAGDESGDRASLRAHQVWMCKVRFDCQREEEEEGEGEEEKQTRPLLKSQVDPCNPRESL